MQAPSKHTDTIIKNGTKLSGYGGFRTDTTVPPAETDNSTPLHNQPLTAICRQTAHAGFTLIETLVSMVILLVGLLALLAALGVAMDHNTRNLIRDDVVRVAEDNMNTMRTHLTFNPVTTVTSSIRGVPKQYQVRRHTTTLPSGSTQYQVDVTWTYRNLATTHSIVSVRGKQ